MRLLLVCAVMLLSGCGAEWEAKKSVKRLLNDPESAQFTSVITAPNSGNVCGFVNAKNRIGGYVGAMPFFYRATSGQAAIISPPTRRDFETLHRRITAQMDFSEEHGELSTKCRLVSEWDGICGYRYPMESTSMCSVLGRAPTEILDTLQSEFGR